MPTIDEIQAEIVEDFSFLPEWDERYAYLIELGQKMAPLPEEHRKEDNIVRGCQSTVWLHRTCNDGAVILQADSDSLIVKGLAALLMKVYSGQPADVILKADLTFFEETGLNKHLSSQRANGLMAMIDEIKAFAVKCAAGEA
ncbi:MAG: SufE family protein [Chloroflexota bacterium]|nr:SufE family protein [Chloroflexota bacterium]